MNNDSYTVKYKGKEYKGLDVIAAAELVSKLTKKGKNMKGLEVFQNVSFEANDKPHLS